MIKRNGKKYTGAIERMIRTTLDRGSYYFTEDTMEFWNCTIVSDMLAHNVFVTAEDNYNRTEILYTVRKWCPETVDVKTVSEFQQFKTLNEAMDFAREYQG